VQPAHRSKALDVLAAIELKYTLLREAVYSSVWGASDERRRCL
jgi:hypothetical protein